MYKCLTGWREFIQVESVRSIDELWRVIVDILDRDRDWKIVGRPVRPTTSQSKTQPGMPTYIFLSVIQLVLPLYLSSSR